MALRDKALDIALEHVAWMKEDREASFINYVRWWLEELDIPREEWPELVPDAVIDFLAIYWMEKLQRD